MIFAGARVLFLLSLCCMAPASSASLLDGKTVGYQFLFGSTVVADSTFVVGSGIERVDLIFSIPGTASLDISDRNIRVENYAAAGIGGSSFIGFRVFDINNTVDSFLGIGIGADTTYPFADSVELMVDADNIYVNFAESGAFFASFDVLSIDVNPTPVPTPAAMWLMGSSLLGLFGLRRKMSQF